MHIWVLGGGEGQSSGQGLQVGWSRVCVRTVVDIEEGTSVVPENLLGRQS